MEALDAQVPALLPDPHLYAFRAGAKPCLPAVSVLTWTSAVQVAILSSTWRHP